MKKFLFLLTALFFTGSIVSAATNMPSAPVWDVPKTPVNTHMNNQSPQTSGASGSVSSIAKSLATAELNGNDDSVSDLYIKLMDMGVTNIQIDDYENACPNRKGITPISIGGKTYTGQRCIIVKYTYQGRTTGTGACK